MALTLGKLTLLAGAGLVGSVLAKEGRIFNVSDFLSGALKIVYKQLKNDDSTTSRPKPRNDSVMHQVNSLREELQLLSSNRSVTIVTGDRSASGKYGMIVIVVVVGYGYIWWKGWKLSDMMFATRGGLNDACSSVAKQLNTVYSSISVTKKKLSSRIDRVDCKLDECADNTLATRMEVSQLGGEVKDFGSEIKSVHHALRSLESRFSNLKDNQNLMLSGVGSLVGFAQSLENSRSKDQIEGAASSSSRHALEFLKASPSRAASLPVKVLGEPPSPSTSNGSLKKQSVFQHSISASGLKEVYQSFSDDLGVSDLSSTVGSSGIFGASEDTNMESSSGGFLGKFSSLLRSRSSVASSAK